MILKNISLGVYYPGDSLLHRLQARTKLLILAWLVVWLVLANRHEWHFAPYITAALCACVGTMLAGISLREIWQRIWLLVVFMVIGAIPLLSSPVRDKRILYAVGPLYTSYGLAREILIIGSVVLGVGIFSSLLPGIRVLWQQRWLKRLRVLLVIVLVASLFSLWLVDGPSATTSLPIGPYPMTYGGVWIVMTVFVVLLVLYAFSLLLTMTTSPVALIEGLSLLLSPLRRLKLPVDDFALMSLIALRFIPTLLEEVEQLLKAQMARGADLSRGTIRERLQSLSMLFIPLMQATLRRAADLAIALEARGYKVEGQQTMLHETSLARIDYIVMSVIACVTIGVLLL